MLLFHRYNFFPFSFFLAKGGAQTFAVFRDTGHIRPLANLEACIGTTDLFVSCDEAPAGQVHWAFTEHAQFRNLESGKCMAVHMGSGLQMVACDPQDPLQQWQLEPMPSNRLQ